MQRKSGEEKRKVLGIKIEDKMSHGAKLPYIEYIRVFAALAVVFLHIVMTLNNNYTVEELGVFNYTVFSDCYMLVKWAVPCFIMVSGALLLNPGKQISVKKTGKYIWRILLVLLTFGVVYALMELVFIEKTIDARILGRALLNTAEGNTWTHMWYIYAMIPIYIIMMPLKDFIRAQNRKSIGIFIAVLFVGNFLIPTVNTLCGTDLKTFMPINEYVTYLIIGYYISTIPNDSKLFQRPIYIVGGIATIGMIGIETYSLVVHNEVAAVNHSSGEILTLIQSVSVFMLMKIVFEHRETTHLVQAVSKCSFGIYLIHPFWINLIYKVLKINPLSMPIGIGIVVLFAVVFVLSFISAWLVKRLPAIKNII